MSYSLDPKRKTPCMLVDMTYPEDIKGIYAGSYEDCEMYMAEQAKYRGCIRMKIVPNPYYKG